MPNSLRCAKVPSSHLLCGSSKTMLITHLNFAKGFRGGERQTQLLIEQLAQQGYEQRLLVRKGSELTKRCRNVAHLEIIEIAKPYIFSMMKLKGTTLLHAHETKALQFAYAAHLLLGPPYIVTRRVDNPISNNRLNKAMYRSARFAVALSHAIKGEILKVSPQSHVKIIPSAYTDTSLNEATSQKIKTRFKNKFLVGHVGALDDRHKGQSFLIEAAKKLQKSHPDIHFILVGGGRDEAMLKAEAKGLENITFEGFVNNVNDYINAFDLFVFPSRNEGLGSILFDVMRLKVPIIASNVGGIPDIIADGVNGILIPPLESDAIVSSVIEMYEDPDERQKLSAKAHESSQDYSPLRMVQQYEALYSIKDKY